MMYPNKTSLLGVSPMIPADQEGKNMQILSLCYQMLKSRYKEYIMLSSFTLVPLLLVHAVLRFYPLEEIFARAVFVGYYYWVFRFVLVVLMFIASIISEGAMIRLTAKIFTGDHKNTVAGYSSESDSDSVKDKGNEENNKDKNKEEEAEDDDDTFWKSINANLTASTKCSIKVFMAGLSVFTEVLFCCAMFSLLDYGVSSIPFLPSIVSGTIRFIIGLAFAFPLMHIITGPFLFFPAIILENKAIGESLKRSWQLVKGRVYFVFTFIFPMGFIRLLLVDTMLFFYVRYFLYPSLAGYITVMAIPTILVLPLQAVFRFVLYAKLRLEKDGISEQDLQMELARQVADEYASPSGVPSDEENNLSDESPNSKDGASKIKQEYTPPVADQDNNITSSNVCNDDSAKGTDKASKANEECNSSLANQPKKVSTKEIC